MKPPPNTHTHTHTHTHAHTPHPTTIGRYLKGGIAFKSTLKGVNAISSFFAWLAQTSFRDVWIHMLTFLLLGITIITAIVTAVNNGGNVYTPQVRCGLVGWGRAVCDYGGLVLACPCIGMVLY